MPGRWTRLEPTRPAGTVTCCTAATVRVTVSPFFTNALAAGIGGDHRARGVGGDLTGGLDHQSSLGQLGRGLGHRLAGHRREIERGAPAQIAEVAGQEGPGPPTRQYQDARIDGGPGALSPASSSGSCSGWWPPRLGDGHGPRRPGLRGGAGAHRGRTGQASGPPAPTGRPSLKRADRRGGPRRWRSGASGILAIACRTIASRSGGIDGFSSRGGGGVSRTCLEATATGVSPMNGGRPVEHLEEHDAERVDVAAGIDAEALGLLG